MQQSFSRRKLLTMLFMTGAFQLVAPQEGFGFILPVHKKVTEDALSRFSFSDISDWERKQILLGVAAGDLVEGGLWFMRSSGYERQFHFDNNFSYEAVIENYRSIAELVDENLAKADKDPWGFGKILHPIQDFYSHSNYVPVYRQYRANKKLLVDSVPTLEQILLSPKSEPGFLETLQNALRTGQYPDHAMIASDTDHGLLLRGMNKDQLSRKYYREAYPTAVDATAWYLRLYLKDKGRVNEWQALRSESFIKG